MEENIKYHHQLPIQLRFNDVDRYGHVNNNAYFSFYDLGKVDYFNLVLKIYNGKPDVVPVIANINADFIAPVLYGGGIVMETCVSHVGRKSFTLEQRAINRKNNNVVCHCRSVMVCFSLKDQISVEVPDSFRRAIEEFEHTKFPLEK